MFYQMLQIHNILTESNNGKKLAVNLQRASEKTLELLRPDFPKQSDINNI